MKVVFKDGFNSERADTFVISSNRQTSLLSWTKILNFFPSKWLKSCQKMTLSCSNDYSEQLYVLI